MNTQDFSQVVEIARREFQSGKTTDIKFRKANLRGLLHFYQENETELADAVYADLGRIPDETIVAEISLLLRDVKTMLANVEHWSQQKTVGRSLATLLDWPYVRPQPRGLVLILSAWNYPLQLSLLPLSGAIAAGCCAVLKPSELAPATAALLADRLPRYLDSTCYPVVCGGVPESQRLLQLRFDHVFFTGSTAVGRLVAAAASQHLTPVTLELGGKSPVYLDDSVNMEYAARRILWGKTVNLGQTCIAPDYLLCTKATEEAFLEAGRRVLHQWFGERPEDSPSLGRMLNKRHFSRVRKLLENSGRVALGGRCFEQTLIIEPTVLTDVRAEDPVMEEEIFGPVLPIITVSSADDAIRFINSRTPHALSLYIFSSRRDVKDRFIRETDSGTVMCNDTMYHAIVEQLPFGGVGTSGMGAYHGKHSFDTFSHYKSVLERNYNPVAELCCSVRYPPYEPTKTRLAKLLLKNPAVPDLSAVKYTIVFLLGLLSIYLIRVFAQALGYEDRLPDFLA
ncbi:aldehyde dehydrogenase family 3 member B1-like [Amphibalanus amphitrite]|uniref:aldehyde dehydrogenase family 3 member B1-like n=1 Tax=Amphibalanus amphitrite TaxID=1232801 RepID=UPI001C910889|nr:aldehyde dehydrogenase family 3 member B1-like [Amphibalanus amphitrite]